MAHRLALGIIESCHTTQAPPYRIGAVIPAPSLVKTAAALPQLAAQGFDLGWILHSHGTVTARDIAAIARGFDEADRTDDLAATTLVVDVSAGGQGALVGNRGKMVNAAHVDFHSRPFSGR